MNSMLGLGLATWRGSSLAGRHSDVFNNANNINPLSTPALFNFDGFLRSGVGDPRQVQLAAKVTF